MADFKNIHWTMEVFQFEIKRAKYFCIFFILDAYLISAGLFCMISCSNVQIVYVHYSLKHKDLFYFFTFFFFSFGATRC